MTQRGEKNPTFIRIFSQKVVTLPYQIILCLAQKKDKPTNNCNIMETLREIIHSIQQNKVRSFMSGFGIMWGIFILVLLLGVGKGVEAVGNWAEDTGKYLEDKASDAWNSASAWTWDKLGI